MKLVLDADVAPDVVQNAWGIFCLASVDERPLSDLESLGWLVLSHNITAVLTLRPPDSPPWRGRGQREPRTVASR